MRIKCRPKNPYKHSERILCVQFNTNKRSAETQQLDDMIEQKNADLSIKTDKTTQWMIKSFKNNVPSKCILLQLTEKWTKLMRMRLDEHKKHIEDEKTPRRFTLYMLIGTTTFAKISK